MPHTPNTDRMSYNDLARRWNRCHATIWNRARRDPRFPPFVRGRRGERLVRLEDVLTYEKTLIPRL